MSTAKIVMIWTSSRRVLRDQARADEVVEPHLVGPGSWLVEGQGDRAVKLLDVASLVVTPGLKPEDRLEVPPGDQATEAKIETAKAALRDLAR
jgi:hypothetical protein